MSDQIALYRKYRPRSFGDVRGQAHIVSVLEGALQKGQIPHALLFCGSRGTGKTTLARLFAESLGTQSVDCYEIDAASNRGIDDVRELREAVHTVPYASRYKVYIIDEVHMLTKEAFNALLKTLEEPPPHVVFILATTEEEKLLDTIRSRCQIFHFHAPARQMLAETVRDVAQAEGVTVSWPVADLVALAADGSFRDALSIAQKVMLTIDGAEITDTDVVAPLIGAPQTRTVAELLAALARGETKRGVDALTAARQEGADPNVLLRVLLERVRVVILLRNAPESASPFLQGLQTDEQVTLQEYAKAPATRLTSHALRRLLAASGEMRFSPVPELPLEIAILEICQPSN